MQAYAKMYLKDGKQTEANALYAQINDIMAGKISEKPAEKPVEKPKETTSEKTNEKSNEEPNGSQK